MSYWKSKPAGEQARRLLEPLIAFVSRDPADEPPERPHVFTIVDEHGVEREVFAPRGYITQIRDFSDLRKR